MPFFSQEKKQQKMILILGVVLIAIFITLYFGFFRSGGTSTPPPVTGTEMGAGGPAVSTGGGDIEDIDFLFLQDPRFLDLKKYGEWPIKPRETGRDNPFEPFEGYTTERGEVPEEPVEETIEEQLEEETLEEVEAPETPVEEPDQESIERETIEELLRLLNGGGE